MNANAGKILIDGNTATALGCVYAGATVAAWYPITPSTSTMDAFKAFCERYRKDKITGENNYLILQAEGVFDINSVFAGILVLTGFALALDMAVTVVEKRLLVWRPTAGETERVS